MVEFDNELLHMSPVHKRLGMSVIEFKPGQIVLSMPLSDEVRGIFEGTVHGGMLATFADVASASCLFGCYDSSSELTVTTDMHVRYYRQPRGGPLRAEAEMVHNGRTLLSAECVGARPRESSPHPVHGDVHPYLHSRPRRTRREVTLPAP